LASPEVEHLSDRIVIALDVTGGHKAKPVLSCIWNVGGQNRNDVLSIFDTAGLTLYDNDVAVILINPDRVELPNIRPVIGRGLRQPVPQCPKRQ
jgi:hypothetical protein